MGAPDWVDVCPIENGDIPASYVSLPDGKSSWWFQPIWKILVKLDHFPK